MTVPSTTTSRPETTAPELSGGSRAGIILSSMVAACVVYSFIADISLAVTDVADDFHSVHTVSYITTTV